MQKENIWRCKDCAFMVNRKLVLLRNKIHNILGQQQAEQHKLLCPITNMVEELAVS